MNDYVNTIPFHYHVSIGTFQLATFTISLYFTVYSVPFSSVYFHANSKEERDNPHPYINFIIIL